MKNLLGWQRVLMMVLKEFYTNLKLWGTSNYFSFLLGVGLTAIVMLYWLTPQTPNLTGYEYNFNNVVPEANYEMLETGQITIADKDGYTLESQEKIKKCDIITISQGTIWKQIGSMDGANITPPLNQLLNQHGCLEVK